ncbi:MAG: MarR family transcriptional regulator [Opitutales bacterium]|jgi:DNA-binding transcriptional regulator GbsR (MarR family)|nr:MarR family transcriptional regulator [Opitutales bacterium]
MTKKEQEIVEQFIEQKGMEYQAEGLPRIAGRLMGLLLIEEGPFAFGELAERLQVSRGSISTNTRLLENLGVIERVSKPGKRGDFFQQSSEPYLSLLAGINLRLNRALANAKQARDGLSKSRKKVQSRLARLETFYQGFIENNKRLIQSLES